LTAVWVPAALLATRGVPSRAKALLAGGLAAYAAAVVLIAVAWPGALGPLAVLALAGWGYATWRARSGAGHRHRQPPGSLGLRSSIRALADYRFYEKQATRFGPIFKTSQFYRPVVCLIGLERCQRFMRDRRAQLTSAPLPINRHIAGGLLRYMPPGTHGTYRKRLQSCMRAQVLAGCEAFITHQCTLEFSDMAARCSEGPASGVRPYRGIDRLIFLVLNRIFFGFQPEEPATATLLQLYGVVDHRKLWRDAARTRGALREIVALILMQAERLRREASATPDSFLGQAIHDDPELITDPIFAENFIYFLHIARCDLAGLCGWLLKMLGDHPDWGLRIRSDRESAQPTGLASRFVDETLRLRQSEYLYRTTADAIEFENFSIPAGWLVRLCIRESHTAADVFERPHEFNPDRFLSATYAQDQYQPFGIYEHSCMGVSLTTTICRTFVEQLVSGFEWTITRDGPMELGLQHHRHWTPSSKLEIQLKAMHAGGS
jgi:cytochrome P450